MGVLPAAQGGAKASRGVAPGRRRYRRSSPSSVTIGAGPMIAAALILFLGVSSTLADRDPGGTSYDPSASIEFDFADLYGAESKTADGDAMRAVFVNGLIEEVLLEEEGDANADVDRERSVYGARGRRVRDRGVSADVAGGGRRSGEEREADEPRGGCGGHMPAPPRPKPRPKPPDVSQ